MARNRFDVDEVLVEEFNVAQLKRITDYIKPYKKTLITTIFFMLISAALSQVPPLLMRRAINEAIPNQNRILLFILTGIYLFIILIGAIFTRYRMRSMNRVGQSIIHDLRLDMFEHLQQLAFNYFDTRPHGRILTRIMNYVNSISDLLSNGIVNFAVDTFTLVIILIYMFLMDPLLTLYALAGVPVMVAIIFLLKHSQRKAQQFLNMKSSNLNAYTQESLDGMQITQLFAREDINAEISHGLGAQYRKAWLRSSRLNNILWPTVDTISHLTVLALYTGFAFWLRSRYPGDIGIGTVVAFSSYVWRFWNPIINLANFYNQLLSGASYLERIFEFLDEEVDIKDKPDAISLPEITGRIEFKDVDFAYDPGVYILKNMSFTIEPGQTIAIVGATGAGKTTIVNLISRFYNVTDGEILLDGYNIDDVQIDSLRKHMGIMLQDPYLFPGTIMENIRYGRLEATDEECIAAAEAVHADFFIRQHPDGYETKIQEKGAGVSAGERQLISFARVLLSDPALFILDEATSSIDTQTEVLLQSAIERISQNRTSFVIAHRLSTIQNADRIFYIGKNGIEEDGSHEELLTLGGSYAALYRSQIEEIALSEDAEAYLA